MHEKQICNYDLSSHYRYHCCWRGREDHLSPHVGLFVIIFRKVFSKTRGQIFMKLSERNHNEVHHQPIYSWSQLHLRWSTKLCNLSREKRFHKYWVEICCNRRQKNYVDESTGMWILLCFSKAITQMSCHKTSKVPCKVENLQPSSAFIFKIFFSPNIGNFYLNASTKWPNRQPPAVQNSWIELITSHSDMSFQKWSLREPEEVWSMTQNDTHLPHVILKTWGINSI